MEASENRTTPIGTRKEAPLEPGPHQVELKHEIEAIVAAYKDDDAKPPLSEAQLAVMAILCLQNELILVTKAEIFEWILDNFKFYKNTAVKKVAGAAGDPEQDSVETKVIFGATRLYFESYEAPISAAHCARTLATIETREFSVSAAAGRLYLQPLLVQPNKGTFPFLELPAELRVRIYEMVFSFPNIVIGLEYDDNGMEYQPAALCLWEREHNIYFDQTVDTGSYVVSRPLKTIFAMLTTNKQIFAEAVPCFYSINRFYVIHVSTLVSWVEFLAPSRLQHLRHISFPYDVRQEEDLHRISGAIKLLTQSGVNTVEILATDFQWFKGSSRYDRSTNSVHFTAAGPYKAEFDRLPYQEELSKLLSKVETVSFRGACPHIEAYFRGMMKEKRGLT